MENTNNNVVSTEVINTEVAEAAVKQNDAGVGLVKTGMVLGLVAIAGWVVKGAIWGVGKINAHKAKKAAEEAEQTAVESVEDEQ